jgi:hypothetical protein
MACIGLPIEQPFLARTLCGKVVENLWRHLESSAFGQALFDVDRLTTNG